MCRKTINNKYSAKSANNSSSSNVIKLLLFVVGAVLGIALFATLFPVVTNNSSCKQQQEEESGKLLAQLVPLPSHNNYHYYEKLPQQQQQEEEEDDYYLKASKPMFTKESGYLPDYEKRYYMPCKPLKSCHYAQRALRELGWTKVNDWENATARLVWDGHAAPNSSFWNKVLRPYQRYNHLPSTLYEPSGSRFRMTLPKIQRYLLVKQQQQQQQQQQQSKQQNSKTAAESSSVSRSLVTLSEMEIPSAFDYFPPSYPLDTHLEEALTELRVAGSKGPLWTFVNNKGQQLYHTTSALLVEKHLELQTQNYDNYKPTLDRYVCNQLMWDNGMPFYVRIFWLVGSLDPLLVFYQDGFVRVGYKSSNGNYLYSDEKLLQFSDLQEYLDQTVKKSRSLRKSFQNNNNDNDDEKLFDPLVHVRNQMKEAIVSLINVHRAGDDHHHLLVMNRKGHEDAFELFTADFIIDSSLQVHLAHTYSDTDVNYRHNGFFGEDYYFLVQKNHELWYSMMLTLEEIWYKQEHRNSMVPLRTTGQFQLIVAGDDWNYEYSKLPKTLKKKKKKKNQKVPVCQVYKEKQKAKEDVAADLRASDQNEGGETRD